MQALIWDQRRLPTRVATFTVRRSPFDAARGSQEKATTRRCLCVCVCVCVDLAMVKTFLASTWLEVSSTWLLGGDDAAENSVE